jgi:glutathione synthase
MAVVMDPIESINPIKDSTLAMMQAAQARNFEVSVIELNGLYVQENELWLHNQRVEFRTGADPWYDIISTQHQQADQFDIILMRKEPPFDMDFVYATYLLEFAVRAGIPVLNNPGSIRDCNEKLFALQFPQCTPENVVSADPEVLKQFHDKHRDVIFKPLDGMGGSSIFRVKENDSNRNVILETLTDLGQIQIMAQKFIPEISQGDTRILLINGEPVPYGLARIPAAGETRGNLAAGGSGIGRPLTDRDRWICDQVGPALVEKGLYFVGIDVIGDYLTEINVTCPTCIRELDKAFDLDIAGDYLDFIETHLGSRH